MSAGKPQAPNIVGMNSIVVTKKDPPILEEIFVELMDYSDFLEPIMSKLTSEFSTEEVVEEENKTDSSEKSLENSTPTTSNEKQVEEIKMLSEVHDPFINLEKCSLQIGRAHV